MKKIMRCVLVAVMLFAGVTGASAQSEVDNTFCFIDEAGNVVPDGSTMTVGTTEEELFPGGPKKVQAKFPLKVKNTSGTAAAVAAKIVTVAKPNGTLQVCFPSNCNPNCPADYTTGGATMAAGEDKGLETEWFPASGGYGEAQFTVQLMLMEETGLMQFDFKAFGPKITVNCIYADPAGIESAVAAGDAKVNVYDITGRPVIIGGSAADMSALGRGVYVCETVKAGKRVVTKKIIR